MPDPINYSALLTPVQPVTAGLDAFQAEQQQSAQRTLATNQIQMQLRQQALQQAALQDAINNPSAAAYRNLALVHPEISAAVKTAHDSLDAETQRQQLQDLTAVQGYLGAGQPDQAQAVLQKHIDAAKKANGDATAYTAIQNLIQSNPQHAQALVGMTLAGTVGADKMAETMGALGKEGRAQAEFPLDQEAKRADINLKNAQAAASANETEVNPATGAYYNKKAPPPAAALSSNNGALDGVVNQIIQSESSGVADAKNPRSSATGAGQFLSGTWVPLISQLHPDLVQGKSQQEILDLRKNPQLAAEATAAYAQDNAQKLGQAGLPVNGATIAMAHRLGPGDAQAVLKAQANTPLAQILSPDVLKANPQYAKMTAGQLGQQLAAKFGATAIDANPGDPNASGEDFLRTLSPQRAALIKAIAEGAQPGPTGRSAASGPGAFLMGQVQQYDPTATSINLPVRQATRKAFTSGTQGQAIVQANTVGGHLAALDGLVSTLDNGNIPFLNAVAQGVETAAGNTTKQKAVTSFNTLSNTLASELTKFYRSSGGSEKDVDEFRKQLNVTNSPTQIRSAIQQMASAVLSKIGALNDSYNSGMGKTTDGLNLPNVNHNAIAQIQRLAGDSSLGGGQAQASAPQVYVNAQGQRIVYDPAAKAWKAAS
jgi:hypothetical protein